MAETEHARGLYAIEIDEWALEGKLYYVSDQGYYKALCKRDSSDYVSTGVLLEGYPAKDIVLKRRYPLQVSNTNLYRVQFSYDDVVKDYNDITYWPS